MLTQFRDIINKSWGDKPIPDEMKNFISKVEEYFIGKEEYFNYYEAIIAASDDLVFEVDNLGILINAFVSDESMLLIPREKFIGKNIEVLFESPIKEKFQQAIDEVLQTKKIISVEFKSPYLDNYFLAKFSILKKSRNGQPHVLIQIHDITESKKAEAKLTESEERLRKLLQNSMDVITVLDENGNIIFDSFSIYTQFGYTQPLTRTSIFNYLPSDDVQRVKDEIKKGLLKTGFTEPMEFRFVSADGNWRDIEIIGNNLLHEPLIKGIVINSRDITERKKIEKSLIESEERYRKLVQNSSDITSIVSTEGIITYVSPSFFRLFGYTESPVGNNIFELVHPEDRQMAVLEFQKGIENGGISDPIEFRFRMSDGDWKYFEIIGNNLLDEPSIKGIILNAREISERKKVEEELIKTKNEAIQASKAKSEFLSNMSHEIRTPMNAIVSLTNLLLEKKFDKETTEYHLTISKSVNNLLVIINDILDFSKIEMGKVYLEKIDFNLHEKIKETYDFFKHKAENKNIELTLEISDEVPQMVNGDPYRLNQILVNLVGNAIKFTPRGSVKIRVKTSKSNNEFFPLVISVQDTGIGIPENKIDSIFESFTQANNDISRTFGGTGLGLAITKKLVQLQNGKIAVKSIPNVGTIFTIEIFYAKSQTPFIKQHQISDTENKNLHGLRILIVEDNKINQFVVKQIVNKWNTNITIVSNGREAIEMLTETDFDIVLMDLQMPEISGFDATQIIRSQNSSVNNKTIPIIALTADAFIETKKKVLEAGMNDFVTKPIDQEELYSKIIKQIKK